MIILRFVSGFLTSLGVIGKVLVTELCPNDEVFRGMAMFGAG